MQGSQAGAPDPGGIGGASAPLDVPVEPTPGGPPLPLGDRVWLRGRGTTFVRRVEGPPGAPTVVLLHGWLASGGLNWFQCFEPLGRHFHVLAPDLRGHGRGIRSRERFTLAACADDVAALIRKEARGPVIAVGYSMGGPVAQLLWRRHPELVEGLVLSGTGADFLPGNRERYVFTALMSVAAGTTRVGQAAAALPSRAARSVFGLRPPRRPGTLGRWARAEMARHDVRSLLEAGLAVGTFSSKDWIHEVDVPTTVLITARDGSVSPTAQARLAIAIPNAHINRIDDGHAAPANADFGRKVADACLDVARRVDAGRHTAAS